MMALALWARLALLNSDPCEALHCVTWHSAARVVISSGMVALSGLRAIGVSDMGGRLADAPEGSPLSSPYPP